MSQFQANFCDSRLRESDGLGCGMGEIDHSTADIRPPVIDPDDDGAAIPQIRDLDLGPKLQSAVRPCQF